MSDQLNRSAVAAASENAVVRESGGVNVERAVDELGSDVLLDAVDDEAIAAYATEHGLAEARGSR